jgi:NAD(P)-dependent dehydrogenase (short-subunit alcohol dehydrogenase family)
MKSKLQNKVTLVTGVSSGIGREIAQLLAEGGARVYGTVRDPATAEPIKGVQIVRLDVKDDASVQQAIDQISREAGTIQHVVNNAGYSLTGALEETSLEEARHQFETNFFGVLRVTKAALPMMRKRGYGRIVNISSVVGFLPAPHLGIYAATKHALEAYTETLDHEVRNFGVHAVLIEPAFTKSKIEQNKISAKGTLAAYDGLRKQMDGVLKHSIENGDEPRLVAEAVRQALVADLPRLRYPIGQGVTLSRLRRFVPARMFDKSFRKQFGLK